MKWMCVHTIKNTYNPNSKGEFTMINRLNIARHQLTGWWTLLTVIAITTIVIFMTNQITQAQRPDRSEMRDRPGGGMRGPGGGGRGFSPSSLIDSSWVDLTFVIKVDNETLIKARPVYQKSRDALEKAMKEARDSGDYSSMREAMMEVRESFKSKLEKVLTEEQLAKFNELEQQRMQRMQNRRGGGRAR
jgi:Spy/CpxP family protein refolding chaperone